jgi:hypothetical protein
MTLPDLRARFFPILPLLALALLAQTISAPVTREEQEGNRGESSSTAHSFASGDKSQVESGSISDNLYRSDFFRFTYQFPEGCLPQGESAQEEMIELGQAILSAGGTKKAAMDASARRPHILLFVSEHPVKSAARCIQGPIHQASYALLLQHAGRPEPEMTGGPLLRRIRRWLQLSTAAYNKNGG